MWQKIIASRFQNQPNCVALGSITAKQLKRLCETIQHQLQNPTASHSHIFVTDRNHLDIIQTIQTILSQTRDIPGWYLKTNQTIERLSASHKETILQTQETLRTITTSLPIMGTLLWAGFLTFIATSNTTENSLPKSWGTGTNIQDTSIFLSFNSVFSAVIMAGFLGASRLLQELPKEKILAHPKFKAFNISTPTPIDTLVGTIQNPGLLFKASLLIIRSTKYIPDLSFFDTLVSNGGFSLPSTAYQAPSWIPYSGMVLITSDNKATFPDITRLSGRLFDLNAVPKSITNGIPQDHSTIDTYNSFPTKIESINPYDLFIGRQEEIKAILTTIDQQTHQFQDRQYKPCAILLHDTIPNTFGVGKTDLAKKIIEFVIQEREDLHITLPGTEVVEKRGKIVTRQYTTDTPTNETLFNMGHISWGVLGTTIIGTYAILYEAQKFDNFDNKSQARLSAFIVICMSVSLGIGLVGLLGYRHIYETFANKRPNKISEKNAHDITQISSVPKEVEDIIGERNPNIKTPQFRYGKSERGSLFAESPYTIGECGAFDRLPTDSKETQNKKINFANSLGSFLETGEYNLANELPTSFKGLVIVTSNNLPENLPDQLVRNLNLIVGLKPIIPFNPKKDLIKLLTLLKKENEAQRGYPFTQNALQEFVEKIQFKEFLPENHIFVARQYWQVLLPYANLIAAEKGVTVIDQATFCEAWHAMVNLTHKNYFDKIFKDYKKN